VRIALYAAATLAVAAAFSPAVLTGALAAAASVLSEATPFLLAGAIAQSLLRNDRLVAYAGCGCACGPSARSIPAAVATALVFGVWVALARLLAATVVATTVSRPTRRHARAPQRPLLLEDLRGLVAAALLAGCASQLTAYVDVRTLSPAVAVLVGIAAGFAAAPCALGAVAIAAALHARAPCAAAGFLCIAGVVDLRAVLGHPSDDGGADSTAYLMLSIALAVVAARHGDALVRPAIAPLLALCAAIALGCAVRYRSRRNPSARLAPAIILAGALIAVPPPAYTVTETTLTDIFPGERLVFTGRLASKGNSAALVRYAITCCRADAAPVAVRLDAMPRLRPGTWIRASGSIEETAASDFRLRVSHLDAVTPPADPFIYR
jgi:hypothetical protein